MGRIHRQVGFAVPEIRPQTLIAQVVEWGYSDICELLFESGQ